MPYGTLHPLLRLKHPGFLALLAVHCAFAAAEMSEQGPVLLLNPRQSLSILEVVCWAKLAKGRSRSKG